MKDKVEKALSRIRAALQQDGGDIEWIEAGPTAIAFKRPGNFACYVNFGADLPLPAGAKVLVASGSLNGNSLPVDTAVWLRLK